MYLKKITYVFIMIVSLLAGGLVLADISPKPSGATKADMLAKELEKSSLQCWQYGKLLFEKNDLTNQTMKNNKEAVVFEENKLRGSTIYIFDMGTATCLYRKT